LVRVAETDGDTLFDFTDVTETDEEDVIEREPTVERLTLADTVCEGERFALADTLRDIVPVEETEPETVFELDAELEADTE
jgi:hypothetical protein